MINIERLMIPFADSIFVKVVALRDLDKDLTVSQRTRFLESISDDVKKCTNFIEPKASKAALDEAEETGADLYAAGWHDQPKFDAKRETFHYEHFKPVSSLRQACLEASTKEEVFEVLQKQLSVVWILKSESEDDKLTQLKYRHKRDNPEQAYQEAGIVIVEKVTA